MKLFTKAARLALVILVLFLVGFLAAGCDGQPITTSPSSCAYDGQAVTCATTLDDCIVQGRGTCDAGGLALFSDGVTATYTLDGQSGTWSRVDTDIGLSSGQTIPLVEGAEGPCRPDKVTGIGFRDSVTVQQTDGSTCIATYTVEGGINTLDCPCTEPTACTAADRYLTAEAKACGVHQ